MPDGVPVLVGDRDTPAGPGGAGGRPGQVPGQRRVDEANSWSDGKPTSGSAYYADVSVLDSR
jgi:hypothetical protein